MMKRRRPNPGVMSITNHPMRTRSQSKAAIIANNDLEESVVAEEADGINEGFL